MESCLKFIIIKQYIYEVIIHELNQLMNSFGEHIRSELNKDKNWKTLCNYELKLNSKRK